MLNPSFLDILRRREKNAILSSHGVEVSWFWAVDSIDNDINGMEYHWNDMELYKRP